MAGAVVSALLIGAGGYFAFSGDEKAGFSVGGPFDLVDGDGRAVADRDFRGKYMLIYFGYASCPDVCPTTLGAIADAMDRLGTQADKVQPIFITVDPKRDTPAVIKRYVALFSSRLVGLTGSEDAVARAAKAYKVYSAKHDAEPGSTDYAVDHSSILYVMGPDGRFLAPISASASAGEIATELERLMS